MEAPSSLVLTMPQVESRIARASYGAMFSVSVRSTSPPIDITKETLYVDDEGTKRIHRVH